MESLPEMPTKGFSQLSQRVKESGLQCFESFLSSSSAHYGTTSFHHLPPSVLCERTIWLQWVHHMVHTEKKSNGELLSGATIIEYLRKVLLMARDKFGNNKEHNDFFNVCDKNCSLEESQNWLKGVSRQVLVVTGRFRETAAKGDAMSKQASPIYTTHRCDIAKQLRRLGTSESLERCLVVHLNGVAAGRPGEVATISTDVMTWDPLFDCIIASWPQLKTHKMKLIAISAGRNRLICPINAFAVAFAAGVFRDQRYEPGGMNFLFPKLAHSTQFQ
jgi:hypothetical protein